MNEFDQKAQEWDMNKMHLERTLAVAGQLKKLIQVKPNMKALEFGAGTGLLSFYLKDLFSEIILMDSSLEMLKMAEKKFETGDHLKFKTCFYDLEKENYTGNTFDIIYSQMVLHHIMDIKDILQKFFHLLNPGGMLAIADLYKEDGTFHGAEMDVHKGFYPESLTEILLKLGFREIEVAPCFVIRKEIPPAGIKEYPVFLLTARN